MQKYTNEQLEQNYNRFLEALKTSFSGERLDKLLHMYSMEELGPNLMLSPASGNKYYHNAYEGGYIDHVINVARNSLRMLKTYEGAGGNVDFTQEELLFTAFHHDLGKLGKKNLLHYVEQTSDWHRRVKNELYVANPDLPFMSHTDRTIFTLHAYDVKITENEFFGMKLTDGMYDEDNEKYMKPWRVENRQRCNIGFVMHWADHMSTLIEQQDVK